MRATLPREALLPAIERVRAAVETRTTLPILSHVLIEAAGDGLRLAATDLDVDITAGCAAAVAAPGALTVEAGRLAALVRALPAGAAVTLAADGHACRIDAARTRASLNALAADDFPRLTPGDLACRFDLPVAQLQGALASVAFAISTEEVRYYLNGVFLHFEPAAPDGQALTFVATDGHRLGRRRLPAPAGAAGLPQPGLIVPRKTVLLLIAALKGLDPALSVTVEASDTKIRVTLPDPAGSVVTSKLIDGSFPDYARVIPAASTVRLSTRRDGLAAALDRVSTISSARGRAVRLEAVTDAPRAADDDPDDDPGQAATLTLSCRNADAGEARDELAATLDAEAPRGQPARHEIGFNVGYLAGILDQLTGDRVTLAMSDPGSPALVSGTDETLTIVLMPMRV